MALWKKNISGQGDPPGPLGKYITMYNNAVKTLGTDNPEVLKRFFTSQQYGQNNTQVQQNNNINKAPQPKESKVGNIAGDVGTLALSTLQNFGMNIPGDVIKTVAPKAAILDLLPQTTTNQYLKQRNQSLGQNMVDVGDAANTVAAFEIGAPLVGKGIQAGVKYASPYVKSGIKGVKNFRFKPNHKEDISFYHFSKNNNLTLNDIDVLRTGESQMKKRYLKYGEENLPSGFYTHQTKYPKFMAPGSPYEIKMPSDIKIKNLSNEGMRMTDRVSKKEIINYQKKGFDVLKGINMIGQDEFIIINKNKIKSFNPIERKYSYYDLKNKFPGIDFSKMSSNDIDKFLNK